MIIILLRFDSVLHLTVDSLNDYKLRLLILFALVTSTNYRKLLVSNRKCFGTDTPLEHLNSAYRRLASVYNGSSLVASPFISHHKISLAASL